MSERSSDQAIIGDHILWH